MEDCKNKYINSVHFWSKCTREASLSGRPSPVCWYYDGDRSECARRHACVIFVNVATIDISAHRKSTSADLTSTTFIRGIGPRDEHLVFSLTNTSLRILFTP